MNLAAIRAAMPSVEPREIVGTVIAVKGLVVVVDSLPLPVGSLVRVAVTTRREHPRGEVVGFDGPRALVMLLSEGHRRASDRVDSSLASTSRSRGGCTWSTA